jgi:hypothetical protein
VVVKDLEVESTVIMVKNCNCTYNLSSKTECCRVKGAPNNNYCRTTLIIRDSPK